MFESVALPLLMKAVDFVFGEGSKILQERRTRRSAGAENSIPTPVMEIIPETSGQTVIPSRDEAVRRSVNKADWSSRENEVKHLLTLVEIQTRNYRLAKEQYAKWGAALVPPIIVNNLQEAEDAIAETVHQLRKTVSGVYGAVIQIPNDEIARLQ